MRMKPICVLVVLVLIVVGACGDASADLTFDPELYTFLSVSPRGYSPSINNCGEIIYVDYVMGTSATALFSSERGQLTDTSIYVERWTGTGVNDSGEAVVAGRPAAGGGYRVYSTVRGAITASDFSSNNPGINNMGEVSYVHNQTLPRGVFTSDRGMLIDISTPCYTPRQTDISDSGEIIYDYLDVDGQRQIFSSTRGQLTTSRAYAGAINSYGDVVYVDAVLGDIRLLDGTVLFDVLATHVKMNDYGDIVFSQYVSGGNGNYPTSRIVVATQRPDFYPQFSAIDPAMLSVPSPSVVPLPGTVLLGAIGLSAAGWRLRKLDSKMRGR